MAAPIVVPEPTCTPWQIIAPLLCQRDGQEFVFMVIDACPKSETRSRKTNPNVKLIPKLLRCRIAEHALPNIALLLVAIAASVICIELAGHALVKPSNTAFGTFRGRELPPMRIIRADVRPLLNSSSRSEGLIVDGKEMTRGDLRGFFRLDPTLGYTYQEDVTSINNWWQSNNVGARARTNVQRSVPTNRTRIVIFGESFAHGSRLPQENAWPSIMNARSKTFEVVNFAVDGYSMAQSLLRYRQIRQRLDYDVALLVFVPEADLWRDVNTLRQLYNPHWEAPLVPRFIVRDSELSLVPALYADPLDLWRRNANRSSPELHDYLRTYDRLYFPYKYEEPPVIGKSLFYKLLARASWMRQDRELKASLMNPQGEALQVSRAIFDSMQEQALVDDAAFGLIILPFEHHWWDDTTRRADVEAWNKMVSFVCENQILCIDLLPKLGKLQLQDVDRAFDDWHFGPKMNGHIASAMKDVLTSRALATKGKSSKQ